MKIAKRFTALAAAILTVIAAACTAPQPTSKPVNPGKLGKLLFGVYEQTSPGSYTQLDQFTQATGVRPAIVSYYSQWWMAFQTGFANEARAHGAEVLVQMQPRQVSCQAVSSGATDSYLEQYASQVKAYRSPVILSFGQEMNGNWYPWGQAGCAPSAFTAAWKHVVQLFRAAGANNVTWLWDPNVEYPGGAPLRDWWPGSSYVDWVGLDGYYAYPADTFSTLFLPSIKAIRSFTDKALLIAESGVTAMDGTGRLKDLYTGASAADAVGVVYFDVQQSGDPEHQDWRLEDSSGMLRTFRSLAQTLMRPQLIRQQHFVVTCLSSLVAAYAGAVLMVSSPVGPGPCCGAAGIMIGYTLPEIRRLLISLVRARSPDPDGVWSWSRWRRRRQYQARLCHYRQRGYPLT